MVPKPDKHGKKRMLCVFWSWRVPLMWRLLPPGTSIDSQLYCNQLSELNVIYQLRRQLGHFERPMVFHQDNAPPQRSNMTRDHITETLRWTVLPQPPYSPEIAPSDYHLFRSLKNFLRGKRFTNDEQVEAAVSDYFESKKDTNFYERGVRKLSRKLVIINHGNHFIE